MQTSFFTSEMTGCRFSVLTGDLKKPRVAHVAGNLSSRKKRTDAEVDAKFTSENPKLIRRLSISGSLGRKRKHDYAGQTGNQWASSAFVYGQRNEDSGEWAFFAQICKGVMSVIKNVTEDTTILGYVDILNDSYVKKG